jgi:RimJ/RimL family protein N-acetyltransferase
MSNDQLDFLLNYYLQTPVKTQPASMLRFGLVSKRVLLVKADGFELFDKNHRHEIRLDSFYLVKNECQQLVGVVYDMRWDLHWYTIPRFRGLGYMTNGLREIIPLILNRRERIEITIDCQSSNLYAKASLSVARKVGFKPADRKYYDDEYTQRLFITKEMYSSAGSYPSPPSAEGTYRSHRGYGA